MALPTSKQIAHKLLGLVESAGRRRRVRLIGITPEQMHDLTGRKLLRGSVLKSIEGMLYRKSVYLLSNRELYVLAPFGALTRALPEWLEEQGDQ